MEPSPSLRARFGPFVRDLGSGELRGTGSVVMLQEQSFQLLRILIEHKGEIATRDEVKKRLWPKDAVIDFEQGINDCIEKLRNVLGDSCENPQYIETLARHGYRLMMAVTFEQGAAAQNAAGGNEDLALRAEERRASLDQSGGHGLSSERTD